MYASAHKDRVQQQMSSVSNDVEAGAGEANRQVFRLLHAAKSAPLRKGGWRPSVKQSKLNRQMCLCSKYLSPAGYYLSPDGVWAHSLQKSNQALRMWCEKPSLFLPQWMNTWSTYKKFTEHQKEMLNDSFFHAGLGKLHNQGRHFALVIRKSFWRSRGNITALLICVIIVILSAPYYPRDGMITIITIYYLKTNKASVSKAMI